jgi:MFS family permease
MSPLSLRRLQAYGLFNLSWATGCLIGPLWAGLVNHRAGWGTMTLTFGLLGAMTAVPTFIWCGGYAFAKRNRRRGNNTDNSHDAKCAAA